MKCFGLINTFAAFQSHFGEVKLKPGDAEASVAQAVIGLDPRNNPHQHDPPEVKAQLILALCPGLYVFQQAVVDKKWKSGKKSPKSLPLLGEKPPC